jgi:hypothetical protein
MSYSMWRHVVWRKYTNVSNEHAASVFKVNLCQTTQHHTTDGSILTAVRTNKLGDACVSLKKSMTSSFLFYVVLKAVKYFIDLKMCISFFQ